MSESAVELDAFRTFEAGGWEQKADPYDRFFGPITDRVAEPLLDAARVGAGTRVLDLATGPGYVAGRAAERGTSESSKTLSHFVDTHHVFRGFWGFCILAVDGGDLAAFRRPREAHSASLTCERSGLGDMRQVEDERNPRTTMTSFGGFVFGARAHGLRQTRRYWPASSSGCEIAGAAWDADPT